MKQRRMTSHEFREKFPKDEKKRPKPYASGEHDSQSAFFSVIRLNERKLPVLRFIFAVPNTIPNARLRARFYDEGLRPGVPDIIIPVARRGYFGAAIENKFGNNVMSPAQVKFRDHLVRENWCFKTCYGLDQQIEFLEWYLGVELEIK